MRTFTSATLCIGILFGTLFSPPIAAHESLVGKWAIDSKCDTPLAVIVIEPLGLSGEDFYCKFHHVLRQANTVNWRGKCNFSERGYEPNRVAAQTQGKRLYYRFAGRGWNGPFDRCPR